MVTDSFAAVKTEYYSGPVFKQGAVPLPKNPGTYNMMSEITQNTGLLPVHKSNVRDPSKLREWKLRYADVGDGYVLHSSRQTYKFTKDTVANVPGPWYNPDDLNSGWFESFDVVGTDNVHPKDSTLIVSAQAKVADKLLNKLLTDIVAYEGNPGDIGKLFSKIQNLKDMETAVSEHYLADGITFDDIPYRSATTSDNIIFAAGKLKDSGKKVLFIGGNANEQLYKMGEPHGVDLEHMTVRAFREERGHFDSGHVDIENPSLDDMVATEVEVRQKLISDLKDKAASERDSRRKGKISAMINYLKKEIQSTEAVYRRLYEAQLSGNKSEIRAALYSIALEQGLSVQEAHEYVDNELNGKYSKLVSSDVEESSEKSTSTENPKEKKKEKDEDKEDEENQEESDQENGPESSESAPSH